jgi:hypothetical protein
MDVNAIWAPHALDGMSTILRTLASLGFSLDSIVRATPELGATLTRYLRDSTALRRAADTWWGAERHFVVTLSPAQVREQVNARMAALPESERTFWASPIRLAGEQDSLSFLALALDAQGRPIGVANSDPATRLFLGERHDAAPNQAGLAALNRDVSLFVRAYPVGLFIEGVGPIVANDAYADPAVWSAFERDRYHGPRVVWGREVNLFLLGAANRAARTSDAAVAASLRSAITRVRSAAEASGFQSELWSYEVRDGRVVPVRYGTGSDVQLWSTTDLAVHFALRRLR